MATHEALDLKARDLGLNTVQAAARLHILPCIGGHIGADNVAALMDEDPGTFFLTDYLAQSFDHLVVAGSVDEWQVVPTATQGI